MLGISLGLSLASRPASPGPAPVGHLRIVPIDANTSIVITPHVDLGYIGYALTFGNGGDESTPPSSIGSPYGGWRWRTTVQLSGIEGDISSLIMGVLHDDIGSVDSAMQANFGSNLFGGHYHGGIVLTSSDLPDLTTERYVSSFSFGYTATITWPTDETADVVYQMAIQEDDNHKEMEIALTALEDGKALREAVENIVPYLRAGVAHEASALSVIDGVYLNTKHAQQILNEMEKYT